MQNQPLAVKQFIRSLDHYDIPYNDLKHLLQSKHSNLVEIFTALLHRPKYQRVAQQLVQNMLNNMYKMVSDKLEIYIINNIWKSEFLRLFVTINNRKNNQQDGKSQRSNKDRRSAIDSNSSNLYWRIFMFLCQKMRSLKYTTRLNALKSFQSLLLSIIKLFTIDEAHNNHYKTQQQQQLTQQQGQGFDAILSRQLRVMLRKQQLVKTMSYSQGLFLQLLEDEYHDIRVATLAVLELVSLKTRYFISSSKRDNPDNQTTHSLKQTILYMLNDEHELVRQRSLVAIFRITQSSNTVINQLYNNNSTQHSTSTSVSVFSPLNQQQMFTILMCLKQNNAVLREKVYQCLKILSFTNIHQLLLVLEKLYQTLLVYKLDKTKIYMLLKTFSYRHKGMMMGFIDENPKENIRLFYDFMSDEQPSCRNFIYKGRLILLREVVRQIIKINYSTNNTNSNLNNNDDNSNRNQKYRHILPQYIVRHLNYVQDTQVKLKLSSTHNGQQLSQQWQEQQKMRYEQQTQQMQSKSMIMEDKLRELRSVIQYELTVREESSFDKELLVIIKNSLQLIISTQTVNQQEEKRKGENKVEEIKVEGKVKDQHQFIRYSNKSLQNRSNSQDIEQGEYCWFDVLVEQWRNIDREQINPHNDDCNNNKSHQQHQQHQSLSNTTHQPTIQQQQILQLLYTDHHRNIQSTISKQQLTIKINQLLFEIQVIQYVFDLNNHQLSQQQQKQSMIKHYGKISHVNRILCAIRQKLLYILDCKQGKGIVRNSNNNLCQVVRAYLRSPWIHNIIKSKQFKIRPITIGRVAGIASSISGGGYSEKLLIIIQHPYKIASKQQFTFHNDNLWLQLLCTYSNNNNSNSNNNSNNNMMRVYLRFEDLFRLSQMRPIIDYNENKTIYTAELGVKINSTKFNNIVEATGRSNVLDKKGTNDYSNTVQGNHVTRGVSCNVAHNKRVQQINAQRCYYYQQKEITINTVAIIYSAQIYDTRSNNQHFPIKHQQQPSSLYKILAQWSNISNNINLNQ